ncbi:class I SAM-dependent methyltransferase [Candidatus Omnitrophota bacterium]
MKNKHYPNIFDKPVVRKRELELFYNTSDKYFEELNRHDEEYFKKYINFLSKYTKENQKILDLGCGNGRSTYLLGKLKEGILAIGCDISFKFLSGSSNFENNNAAYLVTDATNLPFKNEQIDIISSFQLIEHISEVEDLLCEMIRVLKNGGLIIIMSPNLLSPFPPLRSVLNRLFNRKVERGFSKGIYQNLRSSIKNIIILLNKVRSGEIKFLFRKPSLEKSNLSPDSDSVYLANQVDLKKFLKKKGFKIINVAKGMSFIGIILAILFPCFSGEIGIVAKKEE